MLRSYGSKEFYRIIESLQAVSFHTNAAMASGLLGPGRDPNDPKTIPQALEKLGEVNKLLISISPQYETQLEFDVPTKIVGGRIMLGKIKDNQMQIDLPAEQWTILDKWALRYTLPNGLVENNMV
jgi:hypothetical protein